MFSSVDRPSLSKERISLFFDENPVFIPNLFFFSILSFYYFGFILQFKVLSILFLSNLVLVYVSLSINVCNSRKVLTKKKKIRTGHKGH